MEWIKFGNVELGFEEYRGTGVTAPIEGIKGRWPAVCVFTAETRRGSRVYSVRSGCAPIDAIREWSERASRAVDGGA